MADKLTWIKLNRSILNWSWYTESNTMRLFIHLLLKANVRDGKFYDVEVKRGDVVTSYQKLAEELGLHACQIRTAINHLKRTGEITVRTTSKFSVISIPKYDEYQDATQAQTQSGRRQGTGKSQQYKNKRNKEEKNNKPSEPYIPLWWERDIPKEYWGRFSEEDDYWNYRQNGGE